MKLNVTSNIATPDDAALVAEVLNGNRDAFGQLVARYQSPVCSLAYSACGNISQSEDLAQETFIIAWRKLGELEEPAKFKSWLYGIARNLVHNASRKQTRNPLAAPELLDENTTVTTSAADPTEHAISQEEAAILWRSLAQIPETYRAPLVLFYREQQSIGQVAAILDVSEEAARQRLSRGRKLLQERVIAFVEGALQQTAPGPVFTLGVLAALPAMTFSAKAATLGAAAKGGSLAAGAGWAAFFAKFVGPLFPFAGMYQAYRQMKKSGAPSTLLRPFKWYCFTIAASVALMVVVVSLLMDHGAALIRKSPMLFVMASAGLIFGYFTAIGILAVRYFRQMKAVTAQAVAAGDLKATREWSGGWEYRSRVKWLGWPLVHIRWGRLNPCKPAQNWQAVKAWVAITDGVAIGGLFAYGGVAMAPVSIGACTVGLLSYGGMAFGVLSWGGFSFGVWAFGASTFGWEAFSGGSAIAWHLAWGYQYAIAHDYALGAWTVYAAQANTPFVEDLFKSTWGHEVAVVLTPYFYWLMWAWSVPMMISMMTTWFRSGQCPKNSPVANK